MSRRRATTGCCRGGLLAEESKYGTAYASRSCQGGAPGALGASNADHRPHRNRPARHLALGETAPPPRRISAGRVASVGSSSMSRIALFPGVAAARRFGFQTESSTGAGQSRPRGVQRLAAAADRRGGIRDLRPAYQGVARMSAEHRSDGLTRPVVNGPPRELDTADMVLGGAGIIVTWRGTTRRSLYPRGCSKPGNAPGRRRIISAFLRPRGWLGVAHNFPEYRWHIKRSGKRPAQDITPPRCCY